MRNYNYKNKWQKLLTPEVVSLLTQIHEYKGEQTLFKNDYIPFVQYTLGVVVAAYREFSSRMKLLSASNISKPERIRAVIKDTLGKITKNEIMEKCPDISQVTVQRALNDLVKSGEILKIGGGRYTAYTWNYNKEK